MLRRKEIEEQEIKVLAPYAMKSKFSRGRIYPEKEHPYRSVYQRDRDRIVHSTAFRRLEYKTQVFVNHEGDYYRTRLTHTLEVSQISRSIARALRLNEDLVEVISLAHDIGHTPFGHSGEEALHNLMQDKGGFNHNLQGLRVVDYLEKRYPDFKGLNLTWEVREGIFKHSTVFDQSSLSASLGGDKEIEEKDSPQKSRISIPDSYPEIDIESFEPETNPTLETQVVNIADEIAYDNHDLDDGLTSGLIHEDDLRKLELWKTALKLVRQDHSNISDEIKKFQIIRTLIDLQVTDLIKNSQKNIMHFKISNLRQVRQYPKRLITFSKSMQDLRIPLRKFLLENLYRHYRVIRMADKARRFIEDLFEVYASRPEQLPTNSRLRLKKEDKFRVICDYIAGMTDRYALEEYRKLFDPFARV